MVLAAGRILIGSQEGKAGSNVGACAGGEPIDRADDTLVDFCTSLEVVVIWAGGGGVGWHTRSIGSNVGDLVHLIDAKTMRG